MHPETQLEETTLEKREVFTQHGQVLGNLVGAELLTGSALSLDHRDRVGLRSDFLGPNDYVTVLILPVRRRDAASRSPEANVCRDRVFDR